MWVLCHCKNIHMQIYIFMQNCHKCLSSHYNAPHVWRVMNWYQNDFTALIWPELSTNSDRKPHKTWQKRRIWLMLMLLRILRRSQFFSVASFKEQWRDWGGIMGWFVPFLLPWDKQQLESSSTAQYLEQTIPSDCINGSEIRLNESTQRWRLCVFGLLRSSDLARGKKM